MEQPEQQVGWDPGMAVQGFSVKNTFIDCDDSPPEPLSLRRSVTEGAPARDTSALPSGPEMQSSIDDEEDPDEPEGDLDGPDGDPESPMALQRCVTQENWEPNVHWQWAFDQQPGAAPTDGVAPAYAAPMFQPTPMPAQQAPGGMVMMPMPMGAMPMMSPFCGVRWPDQVSPAAMQMQGAQPAAASAGPPSEGVQVTPTVPFDAGGEGAAEDVPPPQTLTRAFSVNSGAFRINWTVSASKLRSADKNAVSPPFELSFGGKYASTRFKLMLFPQASSEGKGGFSFRKSKGKGYIQLKCEADLHEVPGTLKFRLFAGGQQPRPCDGAVTHDFSHSAVKGLPKEIETWDFDKSVTDGYFVVGAEIIPRGGW